MCTVFGISFPFWLIYENFTVFTSITSHGEAHTFYYVVMIESYVSLVHVRGRNQDFDEIKMAYLFVIPLILMFFFVLFFAML